jgi:hypothetical protein
VLAAEGFLAAGDDRLLEFDGLVQMAAETLELGQMLQCFERERMRIAKVLAACVVDFAIGRFGLVET